MNPFDFIILAVMFFLMYQWGHYRGRKYALHPPDKEHSCSHAKNLDYVITSQPSMFDSKKRVWFLNKQGYSILVDYCPGCGKKLRSK